MFFELLSFIVCPRVLIFTRRLDDLTALHIHRLSVYNVVCVYVFCVCCVSS